MEDLTNQQFILLVLLVSFVASIATSVSVVSLLNESPTTITQTVNRIVERTIEKVVPEAILPTPIPPKETPAPETAVTTEAESLVRAVRANLSSVAVIWSGRTSTEEGTRSGLGFVVSPDGLMAIDKNVLQGEKEFTAVFQNNKTYRAVKVFVDEDSNLALLELQSTRGGHATGTLPVSFSQSEPDLGLSVAAIGGASGAAIFQGIISEKPDSRFVSNIPLGLSDRGGPLFGLDGKVLGMNTLDSSKEGYTLPAANILSLIKSFQTSESQKIP